ncbi:hypothetical protein F444_16803 [Phytophthora nicotianae P1976]|uniref:Uncharacterized protein n=1 Tax=Phytophthora nicotianae P1976 TaxID=1317066 RepID=A0A080ZH46_PHYNI|nr:hypothetical protein F444_16803 [Phytophthora nicotianae P1976]
MQVVQRISKEEVQKFHASFFLSQCSGSSSRDLWHRDQ